MGQTGARRSTIYRQIEQGLLPAPVKLGAKFACWPQDEISKIIKARISGTSPEHVKRLVMEMVEQRKAA